MEILIPGLILVALMVYASTRIKRNAAAAFDAEAIETDDFVIQKPEGFLHNLNGDPKFAFEAYSKDFSEEHPKMRIGLARVEMLTDTNLDQAEGQIRASGECVEELHEVIDSRPYRILDMRKNVDEAEANVSYKLATSGGRVVKLEVVSLDEAQPAWLETFIDSFRVK